MTVHLTGGTLESTPNLDGWIITSETAVAEGADDMPLQRGDRIAVTGDAWRNNEVIGNLS